MHSTINLKYDVYRKVKQYSTELINKIRIILVQLDETA